MLLNLQKKFHRETKAISMNGRTDLEFLSTGLLPGSAADTPGNAGRAVGGGKLAEMGVVMMGWGKN